MGGESFGLVSLWMDESGGSQQSWSLANVTICSSFAMFTKTQCTCLFASAPPWTKCVVGPPVPISMSSLRLRALLLPDPVSFGNPELSTKTMARLLL